MARKSQRVRSRGGVAREAWSAPIWGRGQRLSGGVVRKRGGIQGFLERARVLRLGREGSSYLDPFPICRPWAPFWLKQIWPIPWKRDCSWWAPKTSLGKHWTRLAALPKPPGASATLCRCSPGGSPRVRADGTAPGVGPLVLREGETGREGEGPSPGWGAGRG